MSPYMHRPPSETTATSTIATISVFGTEVALPTYFQVVERYNAGHSIDSILVHMVAAKHVSNINTLRDIIEGIVLNLRLIETSSQSLMSPERTNTNSRRNSRIEFVGELDDLSSVHLMAEDNLEKEKEKERLSLRQRLLARLG